MQNLEKKYLEKFLLGCVTPCKKCSDASRNYNHYIPSSWAKNRKIVQQIISKLKSMLTGIFSSLHRHYVRFSQFYWHFEILNRKTGYFNKKNFVFHLILMKLGEIVVPAMCTTISPSLIKIGWKTKKFYE